MNTWRIAVRVVGAISNQDEIIFEEGKPVPPITLGTEGTVRLQAEGVATYHAMLAFNGETLFIGALGPSSVRVNHVDIRGRGWVVVPNGTIVEIGCARLLISNDSTAGSLSDDALTIVPRDTRDEPTLVTEMRLVIVQKEAPPPTPPPPPSSMTRTFISLPTAFASSPSSPLTSTFGLPLVVRPIPPPPPRPAKRFHAPLIAATVALVALVATVGVFLGHREVVPLTTSHDRPSLSR